MGNPYFRFINRDDPGYNPYGNVFSERQEKIINGEYIPNLRKNEVTTVIKKAEKNGQNELAQALRDQYEDFMFGCKEVPIYDLEEAKSILQSLTPFHISAYENKEDDIGKK